MSVDSTARAIVSRFRAGDPVRHLAWDFDTTEASIQDCIRWALSRYRGDAPYLEAGPRPPGDR